MMWGRLRTRGWDSCGDLVLSDQLGVKALSQRGTSGRWSLSPTNHHSSCAVTKRTSQVSWGHRRQEHRGLIGWWALAPQACCETSGCSWEIQQLLVALEVQTEALMPLSREMGQSLALPARRVQRIPDCHPREAEQSPSVPS